MMHNPDKLRITFVLPTLDLSGGIRVISALTRELHHKGHTVLVVAGPPVRPPIRDRLRAAVKGSEHRWWSDPHKHHFKDHPATIIRLKSHRPVRDSDLPEADVVIATWWQTANAVARLSPSRGAKAYYIQHHEVHMTGQPAGKVNATFTLPLYKMACSGWVRDQVTPHAGGASIPVVTYGVDRTVFDAPPRDPQSCPTVGFMYSDVNFKGTDTILPALDIARKSLPDLRVVTFGAHPPVAGLPLPPNTHFEMSPAQPRIGTLYGMCDAWIMGSRAEGFGLPLLEALACRTPLISTRTGAAEDLIEPGVNGLIAPIEDPAALGAAVVEFFNKGEQGWKAMSDAAYATAARHTWSDAADRFEAQLRSAIAQHTTHAS